MEFSTFKELLQFRSKCLCDSSLQVLFSYNTCNNSSIFLRPTQSYSYDKNTFIFPLTLEMKEHPFIEINFSIYLNDNSNTFSIIIHNNENCNISLLELKKILEKFFNNTHQDILDIKFSLECSKKCIFNYQLKTNSINFDLNSMNISIFKLEKEFFDVYDTKTISSKKYSLKINYLINKTKISMPGKTIIIPTRKFLNYSFDNQKILDKINLLITFS